MFEKLRFYTQHSLNDLRVNGQRTLFALLCIAAGVAAIVSLQTLGVMIKDTLTGSLQESNKGDLRVYPRADSDTPEPVVQQGKDEGVVESGGIFTMDYFTTAGVEKIQGWFDAHYPGTRITYRQSFGEGTDGAVISNPARDIEQTFISPYVIDASQYPLYGKRTAESGKTLAELIQAPTDIVISRNLADRIEANVGDTLKLSGASQDFTLRGIVPTSEEGGFDNLAGNLIGYYYIDLKALPLFTGTFSSGVNEIYVRLAAPEEAEAANKAFLKEFPYLTTTTTHDLEEQNSQIADVVNQLVIIMGLISLLIGGIGIVNTMLVIVSRRTTEIAVLKTIGLEGEQVTTLFLVEAILMGVFGSLIGIVLGWLAAYALKGVAGAFLAESLGFRITLMPALTGFVVGVIVTGIFGFMPTLAAGQVRPNLVLRPSDTVVPKAGRARSLAALLVVMLAISLVAQPLIRDLLDSATVRSAAQGVGALLGLALALTILAGGLFAGWARRHIALRILRWILLLALLPTVGGLFGRLVPALLILFGTFIITGVLYVVLWALIWLVGRFFPTWRFVDFKLALRSMLATKGRGASTLLALVVGVFTLSLITMLATTITRQFEQVMQNEVGGNVIVFAAGSDNTLDQVNARLAALDGVRSFATVGIYDAEVVSAQDVSAGQTLTFAQLKDRVKPARRGEGPDAGSTLEWMLNGIDARQVDANLPDVTFYKGRQLNAADTGPWDSAAGEYPPIVIKADEAVVDTGLDVGDLLTYKITGGGGKFGTAAPTREMTFRIVGMIDRRGGGISVNFGSGNFAPLNAFPDDFPPAGISAVVDVDESQVRAVRRTVGEIPGAFVLETRLLNDLINRVIDQFTSFPILVAALALVVGGIVIANSVALSTLERRREIAIMKAVGLQRERVLGMLLFEYGLMGFIGGLIGVGIGGVGLLLLLTQAFNGDLGSSIPIMTALELMLLCIGIALAAAVLTAWGASGEKPLNVLRYE